MFDKILHDDHLMSIDVLDRHNTLPIFSLRNPRATIPSIMTLYNSVDSTHAFNSSSVATDYYIQRLATLENLAESIQRPFFYLDAESLIQNTEECLSCLSTWMQLKIDLVPTYSIQKKTSQQRYGDISKHLGTRRVIESPTGKTRTLIDPDTRNRALGAYQQARRTLIQKSDYNSVSC
ncbi:MAG: hypothetical protein HRT77_14930 [Halioglobus sp.]|nr:hypothetical protein [Halioglobus sp.]